MSSSTMGLIELVLVLGVVFGWGLYELRSLKKYRERDEAEKIRNEGPNQAGPIDDKANDR